LDRSSYFFFPACAGSVLKSRDFCVLNYRTEELEKKFKPEIWKAYKWLMFDIIMSILNGRRDFLIGNFQGEMKNNKPETRQQTFKEGIINGK
jgi:hypothetical protein